MNKNRVILFAHCKFIGYANSAMPLLAALGLDKKLDGGFVKPADAGDAEVYVQACRALRFWEREASLDKK